MNYAISPQRSPCSVCGLDTFRRTGWFLVVENRWLDRVKILSWHSSLATQKDMKSVCCRQHLKTLLGHWLTQASLHLPPAHHPPLPFGSDPTLADLDLDPYSVGRLLGELSVHRESFSRGWSGSPARKSSAPSATSALVPMPSGSPWHTNSPPLCPAKPTSSTLPRPTASGRISSPKCSPPLHLRCLPTRLTRLPPTPTCWPSMSIKCAPRNRARPAPSTPVISFGNVWAWTQSSPKPASVSASGN